MTKDDAIRPLRRLSAEEIELWLSVAATVTRRKGARLPTPSAKPQVSKPTPASRKSAAAQEPDTPAPRSAPPSAPGLERRLRQKLARGRLGVDAALDLHGLQQAEAHSALRHFLRGAQRDGARIVLVVTGKGGRHSDPFDISGGNMGVLRRSVPHWLVQPDLRDIVAGVEEAARPHGGVGALYVRLRRRD